MYKLDCFRKDKSGGAVMTKGTLPDGGSSCDSDNSEFSKLVKKCRLNNLDRIIHNSSSEHAQYLIRQLIEEAADKGEPVKIVSGTLREDFYEGVERSAKKALDKKVPFEVLVLYPKPEADIDNNRFAKFISENGGTVNQAKSEELRHMSHFVLTGNRRFRIETDHENAMAVANFNDPVVGSICEESFITIKSALEKGL